MSSPETAGTTEPSLARDWLSALRYWLRGPKSVAVLVVSALVVGAALNWSWLVAVGIAPLLLTVLPCALMCGLGLCMNKMTGSSCSTSSRTSDHSSTPMPDAVQRIGASGPDERTSISVTAKAGALPDLSSSGAVEPAPDEQPQVLKERE
jgi:hypothetical protein